MSEVQPETNRKAIDQLPEGFYYYTQRPSLILGPLIVPAASANVASRRKKREKQSGRKINNIRGTNVVILKRLTVEETNDHLEYHFTYPIIAAIQSQKSATPKVS